MATPENISEIEEYMNSLGLDPGFTLIMELFGNSTYRYEQFDGTRALPFKYGSCYHMEGRIGVCDDDSFLKLLNNATPIINAGNPELRIFVPPLPRYVFTGCCNAKKHSTNVGEPDYKEKILGSTMHFRSALKNALLKNGIDNFFVMDGVGSLVGIPPGGNRGAIKNILPELESVMAKDGVHFTDEGYKNLSIAITLAITGLQNGTLTKSKASHLQISGEDRSGCRRKEVFFWRGFSSPVGSQHAAKPPADPAADRDRIITTDGYNMAQGGNMHHRSNEVGIGRGRGWGRGRGGPPYHATNLRGRGGHFGGGIYPPRGLKYGRNNPY
jgi:hypothetical protein